MDRTTTDTLANEANDAIHQAGSTARRKVNELVDWGKDQASRLKGTSAANIWGSTVDYVKANPGKAILVSLAVGVVIGSMVRRRGGE